MPPLVNHARGRKRFGSVEPERQISLNVIKQDLCIFARKRQIALELVAKQVISVLEHGICGSRSRLRIPIIRLITVKHAHAA